MRMSYFGDSYDVVKQSLLRWLGALGKWSVHPMFTEFVSPADVSALETLLGAKVIATSKLTIDTNRVAYFSCVNSCGNLFLDPNTGLRLQSTRGICAPDYLFADDLVRLAEQRPTSLSVVFDQSVARGSEHSQLNAKLRHLVHRKVFGFAYVSHACFVIAGMERSLVERARSHIIAESKLPEGRFLSVPRG